MLYMFNSAPLALPRVKVADRVPPLVRWLMNNTDQLLNYHHLKHIWRLAVFFLRKEYEIFQWFLEAYAVKMWEMYLRVIKNHAWIDYKVWQGS